MTIGVILAALAGGFFGLALGIAVTLSWVSIEERGRLEALREQGRRQRLKQALEGDKRLHECEAHEELEAALLRIHSLTNLRPEANALHTKALEGE